MYLLAVVNKGHYPDVLDQLDVEIATNDQLIELKEFIIQDSKKVTLIGRLKDTIVFNDLSGFKPPKIHSILMPKRAQKKH